MASSKDVVVRILGEDRTAAAIASARKGVGGLSKALKDNQATFAGIAAVGTAAFVGISAVIYKSVQAASEAEQAQAQLKAVLKSTGEAAGVSAEMANDLASSLQQVTIYSDDAILATENLLLTFTGIGKEVFPEATRATLDLAAAMGTDTKGAAVQLGKALNDPINGITALTRVGVTFSQEQQDVIKNLVETGRKAEAQKIILAELKREFGGSAEINDFADRLAKLKENMGETGEAIGRAFIPIIEKLYEKLNPVVLAVNDWIQANPQLTAAILATTLVMSGLAAAIGAAALAAAAFDAVAWPIVGVVALLVAGVALLAYGLYELWNYLGLNELSWADLFQLIDDNTGLVTFFKDVWMLLVAVWQEMLVPALNNLLGIWEKHKDTIGKVAALVGEVLVFSIKAAVIALTGLIALASVFIRAFTAVASWLSDIFMPVIELIVDTVNLLIHAFEKAIRLAMRLTGMGGSVVEASEDSDAQMSVDPSIFGSQESRDTISDNGQYASPAPTYNLSFDLTGATLLDQDAAKKLGDVIMGQLGTQLRI